MPRRRRVPIVVGIDAGFTATGLVAVKLHPDRLAVVAVEVVRTQPSGRKRGVRVADDDAERATTLFDGVREFLGGAAAAGAVVELPTGGARGARANRTMGIATAAVCAAVRGADVPVEWVTPRAVKVAAGGRPAASKAEVAAGARLGLYWDEVLAQMGDMPISVAEHVWDAAGAVLAAQGGTLIGALRRRSAG